jgi:hypothetical protein
MYNVGAIENAKLQQELFPDWTCRFYIDKNDCDETTVEELNKLGCDVQMLSEPSEGFKRLFWRMRPSGERTVERFIIQDTDSRLNIRVKSAVDDWINNTNKPIILMRDHYCHSLHIQGGMWGGKGGIIKNYATAVEEFCQQQIRTGFKDFYFLDQMFLNQRVWPKIEAHHVAYIGNGGKMCTPYDKDFPVALPAGQFVGQVWDENNQPVPASRRNPLI